MKSLPFAAALILGMVSCAMAFVGTSRQVGGNFALRRPQARSASRTKPVAMLVTEGSAELTTIITALTTAERMEDLGHSAITVA